MVEKAWDLLDEWERDYILADLMEWAWAIHQVDLILRVRANTSLSAN